jgi:hypothetical protein
VPNFSELPTDQKNSPSRWRFRPLLRPTFRFRVLPPGEASTYFRSVLDASGTLGRVLSACKRPFNLMYAICEQFIFPQYPHRRDGRVGRAVERGLEPSDRGAPREYRRPRRSRA